MVSYRILHYQFSQTSVVEHHPVQCKEDGALPQVRNLVTYKGRVMIVSQQRGHHITMPMDIRLNELASLIPGEPGMVFEGHYNDSSELFTTIKGWFGRDTDWRCRSGGKHCRLGHEPPR